MLSSQEIKSQTLVSLIKEKGPALFDMENLAFIQLIQKVIPEAGYLKGEANASPEKRQEESKSTKSVYGLTEVEEIRAFAGLWLFKQAYNNRILPNEVKEDYESFIACQKGKKPVLSYESFLAIRQYITDTLKTPEDFAAAMWSILCNDLGKVKFLVEEYKKSHSEIGHDKLLAELLKERPDLFPGFLDLSPTHQKMIIAGYASGCDISMFEQLETPMVCLSALTKLDSDKGLNLEALKLYILHTIFDVAGAAAQFNANGSFTMHQETWDFFEKTRELLEKLNGDNAQSIEQVYNAYLQFRGERINIESNTREEKAMIRIAGLTRLATPAQGVMLRSVWESLPATTKHVLTEELNVTGSDGKSAIFVGYGPAMLLNIQGALQKEVTKTYGTAATPAQRAAANHEGLRIGLIMMAKIFVSMREILGLSNQNKVFVAECDLIVKSTTLNENPRLLVDMNIAAIRREGDDRRIDFTLNTPVLDLQNTTVKTLVPEGTTVSDKESALFKPAVLPSNKPVSVVAPLSKLSIP